MNMILVVKSSCREEDNGKVYGFPYSSFVSKADIMSRGKLPLFWICNKNTFELYFEVILIKYFHVKPRLSAWIL